MYILGLSGLAHDSAAVLLGDRGVVAASEESKLLRSRLTAGIPTEAIRFCLASAGISWDDLSHVAVASQPVRAWSRRAAFRLKHLATAPAASAYYQTKAVGELARELNHFRVLREMRADRAVPIAALEHHACHAAAAFYASSFERAAVLTLDQDGDGWSGAMWTADERGLRLLSSIPFPHSIGWVYSQLTEVLGFRPGTDEHKTQWASLQGSPVYHEQVLRLFRQRESGVRLDPRFFRRGYAGQVALGRTFLDALGLSDRWPPSLTDRQRFDLASSLQRACADVVVGLARRLQAMTSAPALCLGGGVFMNGLLVEAIERESGFDDVFVLPAAGNEGTAAGAAWLSWHRTPGATRHPPISHLYWGPSYTNEDIKRVLDNCKGRSRLCDTESEQLDSVISLLTAGGIVGWLQGHAEFGPRALGNRSLVASPWAPYVKENLNEYVKQRESFRPFALAVPEEDASRYFEWTAAARFMASMARLRPEARELLQSFALPDDRVRLHVVGRSANPLFWNLLRRFGERARAPILVNTSFNLFGEPLVVSPRDAVRSYFSSGMDGMLIGSFLLTKS